MREWQSEPDLMEWTHRGLPCRIQRADVTGALCGYVGLHRRHAFYRVNPEAIFIEVHGGITYAAKETDGLWWLGFDCSHGGDYMPRIAEILEQLCGSLPALVRGQTYKPLPWVKAETERLAAQLWKERHGRRRLRKRIARRNRAWRKALVRIAGRGRAEPWAIELAREAGIRIPRSLR